LGYSVKQDNKDTFMEIALMSNIFKISIIALILTNTASSVASNASSSGNPETSLLSSLLNTAINNPHNTILAIGGLGFLYSSYTPKSTVTRTIKATGKTFIKTIASDLGFIEKNPYNRDESILKRSFFTGYRLLCYDIAAKKILFPMIEKSGVFGDVQGEFLKEQAKLKSKTESVQFGNKGPDPFSAIIMGPVCEELVYSYALGAVVGPTIGSTIFGLCHTHENSTIHAVMAINAGIGGFINSRHLHHNFINADGTKDGAGILAPIMAHSMYNAVAYMRMKARQG